jgi:hypothetical protein
MSHGNNHPEPTQPDPASLARGHELADARPGAIVGFTIYLTVTLIVVVLITLGLFYIFTGVADREVAKEYVSSPLDDQRPESPAPPLQPSPNHLTLPYQDSIALKAEYERLSRTYGDDVMADHTTHERIPITAAISILADQGIPSNTATDIPTPQGPGQSVPTPYSGGGRGYAPDVAAPPGVPQQ